MWHPSTRITVTLSSVLLVASTVRIWFPPFLYSTILWVVCGWIGLGIPTWFCFVCLRRCLWMDDDNRPNAYPKKLLFPPSILPSVHRSSTSSSSSSSSSPPTTTMKMTEPKTTTSYGETKQKPNVSSHRFASPFSSVLSSGWKKNQDEPHGCFAIVASLVPISMIQSITLPLTVPCSMDVCVFVLSCVGGAILSRGVVRLLDAPRVQWMWRAVRVGTTPTPSAPPLSYALGWIASWGTAVSSFLNALGSLTLPHAYLVGRTMEPLVVTNNNNNNTINSNNSINSHNNSNNNHNNPSISTEGLMERVERDCRLTQQRLTETRQRHRQRRVARPCAGLRQRLRGHDDEAEAKAEEERLEALCVEMKEELRQLRVVHETCASPWRRKLGGLLSVVLWFRVLHSIYVVAFRGRGRRRGVESVTSLSMPMRNPRVVPKDDGATISSTLVQWGILSDASSHHVSLLLTAATAVSQVRMWTLPLPSADRELAVLLSNLCLGSYFTSCATSLALAVGTSSLHSDGDVTVTAVSHLWVDDLVVHRGFLLMLFACATVYGCQLRLRRDLTSRWLASRPLPPKHKSTSTLASNPGWDHC